LKSSLLVLLRASDETSARAAAESALDDWFQWGYLSDGDNGHIDDNLPVICGSTDASAFADALLRAQDDRRKAVTSRIGRIYAYRAAAGIVSVDEVRLEEESNEDMGMLGYHIRMLGSLIARNFDPECVLYNAETNDGGVSPAEFADIVSEAPEWALVAVIVG